MPRDGTRPAARSRRRAPRPNVPPSSDFPSIDVNALALLLDPGARPVIAHRGASGHAPENTLPSFLLAAAMGADAIELDVHATADGAPVVIHDPTLDRTTDARGAVRELPLRAVRDADAGARFTPDGGRTFPFRGLGVRVPTLGEVLRALPLHPVVIEVKAAEAQEAIMRAIDEAGARHRCIIAAGAEAGVRAVRAAGWLTGACGADAIRLRFPLGRGLPARLPYRALFVPERHRGLRVVTGRFVRAARSLRAPVHVWTVNDAARANALWERGVAGIITNYPDVIMRARASARGA